MDSNYQDVPRLASSIAPPHRITPLVTEEDLKQRIVELGQEVTKEYAALDPIFVGVLQGAFPFMADLIRELNFPVTTDFIRVSSYGNRVLTSGEVKMELDLANSIANRHVVLVEDIIDTGLTVQYLRAALELRQPKSLQICTLLHKAAHTVKISPVDFVGFDIPNKFVVGYGLDYHGYYRNLPFIAELIEQDSAIT